MLSLILPHLRPTLSNPLPVSSGFPAAFRFRLRVRICSCNYRTMASDRDILPDKYVVPLSLPLPF